MSDDETHDEDSRPGGEEHPERTIPPASEKQINFIQALRKQVPLSDEELATLVNDVTNGTLEDLTVKSASEVIDEIKIAAREKGIDLDAQPKCSEKQAKFIHALRRRAHLTAAEFKELLKEKGGGVEEPEELGKRDASAVIEELLALEKAGGKKGTPAKKTVVEDDGNYDDVPF